MQTRDENAHDFQLIIQKVLGLLELTPKEDKIENPPFYAHKVTRAPLLSLCYYNLLCRSVLTEYLNSASVSVPGGEVLVHLVHPTRHSGVEILFPAIL